MATPRDPRTGRFACVPTYPRLRTSPCGCGGGGAHPCPVGRKLRPVREAAKRAYRPSRYTPEDVEELERELYGAEEERAALAYALDYARTQVKAQGNAHHRAYGSESLHPKHSRRLAVTAVSPYSGEESEQGYEDLLDQRRALIAHDRHLASEISSLRAQLARANRSLLKHQAGAARRRPWFVRQPSRHLRRAGAR